MAVWLTAQQAISYAGLTTEALALSLPGITLPGFESSATSRLHAAGLSFAGLPAAFAVVRCCSSWAFEVLSLVVAEPFRRLGLARVLLKWLVNEAQHFGYSSVAVTFPRNHACTLAMERLTPKIQGWAHAPGLRLVHFDRKGLLALLDRVTPMAARWECSLRFRSIGWSALSAQQHQQITAAENVPVWALPDRVVLGDGISTFDATVSQVLLDNDNPAGWLLVNRIGSSLGRVTAWWVRPELEGKGLAVILLKPAIAMGLEREPAFAACSLGIGANSPMMQRLSRRCFEPFSCQQQVVTRAVLQMQTHLQAVTQ